MDFDGNDIEITELVVCFQMSLDDVITYMNNDNCAQIHFLKLQQMPYQTHCMATAIVVIFVASFYCNLTVLL